ncbi:hypothetical protein Bbelb_326290 [Branchiostoma belcheri]|nr:hypothetical protein Bbelb_326290 [Branchiostoma belcheri]
MERRPPAHDERSAPPPVVVSPARERVPPSVRPRAIVVHCRCSRQISIRHFESPRGKGYYLTEGCESTSSTIWSTTSSTEDPVAQTRTTDGTHTPRGFISSLCEIKEAATVTPINKVKRPTA